MEHVGICKASFGPGPKDQRRNVAELCFYQLAGTPLFFWKGNPENPIHKDIYIYMYMYIYILFFGRKKKPHFYGAFFFPVF